MLGLIMRDSLVFRCFYIVGRTGQAIWGMNMKLPCMCNIQTGNMEHKHGGQLWLCSSPTTMQLPNCTLFKMMQTQIHSYISTHLSRKSFSTISPAMTRWFQVCNTYYNKQLQAEQTCPKPTSSKSKERMGEILELQNNWVGWCQQMLQYCCSKYCDSCKINYEKSFWTLANWDEKIPDSTLKASVLK